MVKMFGFEIRRVPKTFPETFPVTTWTTISMGPLLTAGTSQDVVWNVTPVEWDPDISNPTYRHRSQNRNVS